MINGKPDEIDYKILSYLQEDARIDFSKLGRLVKLSHSPVTERIRKLQEAGFIKKYITVLDREKAGQPVLVILMIKLKDPDTKLFEHFEQLLTQMPEVQSALHVASYWNFIVQVSATTPQTYHQWLMEKITCHTYIANTESAFLLKDCKSFGPLKLS